MSKWVKVPLICTRIYLVEISAGETVDDACQEVLGEYVGSTEDAYVSGARVVTDQRELERLRRIADEILPLPEHGE